MRLLICVALLCACGKQRAERPMDIQSHVALQKAATCDDLARTVQDTAVRQMRSQLDLAKDGSFYGVALPAAGGAPAAGGVPASYTTTNTQVSGVDEADFMKNDGTRIFVLSGRTLFAATSWPPQELALAGKLEIEGWPASMFLEGNQLVVFSNVWMVPSGGGMGPGLGGPGLGVGGTMPALPCPSGGCYWGWATAKVTVVDVSALSAPRAVSELYLPGYSTGARRVGSSVRLVLSDSVRWPEALRWWPEYDPGLYQDMDKLGPASGSSRTPTRPSSGRPRCSAGSR